MKNTMLKGFLCGLLFVLGLLALQDIQDKDEKQDFLIGWILGFIVLMFSLTILATIITICV